MLTLNLIGSNLLLCFGSNGFGCYRPKFGYVIESQRTWVLKARNCKDGCGPMYKNNIKRPMLDVAQNTDNNLF